MQAKLRKRNSNGVVDARTLTSSSSARLMSPAHESCVYIQDRAEPKMIKEKKKKNWVYVEKLLEFSSLNFKVFLSAWKKLNQTWIPSVSGMQKSSSAAFSIIRRPPSSKATKRLAYEEKKVKKRELFAAKTRANSWCRCSGWCICNLSYVYTARELWLSAERVVQPETFVFFKFLIKLRETQVGRRWLKRR